MKLQYLVPCIGALLSHSAVAACPDADAISAYLVEFRSGKASAGFGKGISLADAVCARSRLIEALPAVLGARVGYKAVFTNPESQKRFGVSGPAWGAMFGEQMLSNGVHVPANRGAKPRYESDFIVVVKDAGLAEAMTPLEALAHIDALVPFIELPDLMLDGAITGAELIATNAAYRGGVLGSPIPIMADAAWPDRLAGMDVIVTDERSGTEIGRAKGSVLMSQPISVAMWLARALKEEGIALKPGDLLSLGGFLASAPVRAGTTVSVRYAGLSGDPVVRVHFD